MTDSVHSSTWLKGIQRIIVVGDERPLVIEGEATSIGRLLLGETIRVTIEGSNVMLTNDTGQTTQALVANWVDGARLVNLLNTPKPEFILIEDIHGNKTQISGDEISNAVIAIIRGKVTLVLPDRGRSVWPTDIVRIESK